MIVSSDSVSHHLQYHVMLFYPKDATSCEYHKGKYVTSEKQELFSTAYVNRKNKEFTHNKATFEPLRLSLLLRDAHWDSWDAHQS